MESGAISDQAFVLDCQRTAVLWNWKAIVPSTNKDMVCSQWWSVSLLNIKTAAGSAPWRAPQLFFGPYRINKIETIWQNYESFYTSGVTCEGTFTEDPIVLFL